MLADADKNRDIVRAAFENDGYQVTVVDGVSESIRLLQERSFDLVFLDFQDGVSAIKSIRALPVPNRDIPILAMTGDVQPLQNQSASDADCRVSDIVGRSGNSETARGRPARGRHVATKLSSNALHALVARFNRLVIAPASLTTWCLSKLRALFEPPMHCHNGHFSKSLGGRPVFHSEPLSRRAWRISGHE
jgi:CheY-like chemotaxis protein